MLWKALYSGHFAPTDASILSWCALYLFLFLIVRKIKSYKALAGFSGNHLFFDARSYMVSASKTHGRFANENACNVMKQASKQRGSKIRTGGQSSWEKQGGMIVGIPIQFLPTKRAEQLVLTLNARWTAWTDSISGKGTRIEGLTPEMVNLQSESVGKLHVTGGKAQQFIGHSFEANA